MNLAVDGYNRNGDSPMSGQDYVGESDLDSNPPQGGEGCGEENQEDGGSNMSGDRSHVKLLTASITHCFTYIG